MMVTAFERKMDVEKVLSNVLQDFLRMVMPDGWLVSLYHLMESKSESCSLHESCVETYEKMRATDEENFSVDMLDISFIKNILQFDKEYKTYRCDVKTKTALSRIGESRNIYGHLTGNESDEQLYHDHLVDLGNALSFVGTVDRFEKTISSEDRESYLKRYTKIINELIDVIDKERLEHLQWKKESDTAIQNAINSNDENAWLNASMLNNQKLLLDLKSNGDIKEYTKRTAYFYTRSAEAGITDAMPRAVRYYIDNELELDRIEDYLFRAYEGNNRNDAYLNNEIIEDISAYKSKFGSVTNDLLALIEKMRKNDVPVEIAENGTYRIKKKPRKPIFIEETTKKTPPIHLPPNLKRVLDDPNNKGLREAFRISDTNSHN